MAQKKSIIERNLRIEYIAIDALVPDPNNARKHSQEQVSRLAMAIAEIGFTNPVLIDQVNGIIAGHARREAARIAGLTMVPCIRLEGLDEATKKALAIADNKFGDMSGWDTQVLAKTLSGLEDLSFDIELTGFDTAELDILLSVESKEIDPDDLADEIDELAEAVTKFGDLWLLGPHRLFCGDALSGESYDRLLDGVKADLVFTDPPFNVKIQGHVSGLGKQKHREFAMASGEMSAAEFTAFLASSLGLAAANSRDGSIHYVCIDFRHLRELLDAGAEAYAIAPPRARTARRRKNPATDADTATF